MGAAACFAEQNDSLNNTRYCRTPPQGSLAGKGPPGQGVQSPVSHSQTRAGPHFNRLPGAG